VLQIACRMCLTKNHAASTAGIPISIREAWDMSSSMSEHIFESTILQLNRELLLQDRTGEP
jgi:hypothetical protein